MRQEGSVYLSAFQGTQTLLSTPTFNSGGSPRITGEQTEGVFYSRGDENSAPWFALVALPRSQESLASDDKN